MKKLIQNLNSGETTVLQCPAPSVRSGHLLINSSRSIISPGTERMLQEFGQSNWIGRARQQPDKVRQVLDKLRTDGLMPTIEAVKAKLDQPIPLGYCNAGTVLEVGEGVQGFAAGDRVASNGYHADIVRVPQNLCARIPDTVDDESAAFTVLGAIALQGIRLAQPTLGEAVVVTGLGLVGLITVQLLRAQGCRVLGIDMDSDRVALARAFGAEAVDLSAGGDQLAAAEVFSRGRGVDAVLITAATSSNMPVSQAAKMCRKRGRIVLVGVTGLELSRADFYEKELTFQVSCSYGPGRYDPDYEDKGWDYPVGFVRWTEQRNFEAVLDMMASGALDVKPLITHRFSFDEAGRAYELLGGKEPSMGIVLEYPEEVVRKPTVQLVKPVRHKSSAQVVAGFIGAGNHAGRVLMPAFRKAGAVLHTVATTGGAGGVHQGRKHGFLYATSDVGQVFENPKINTVVIATRHDTHARYVCQALAAGKHVFVEKPLALSVEELENVKAAYIASGAEGERPVLMVGFNRRFAPHVVKIKQLLNVRPEPKAFVMTVNAGAIPTGHWTQDLDVGGGRIIGEACHFIDLLRHLADAPITDHHATFMKDATRDTSTITLKFDDGSIGTIHYLANGDRSFPKERLEVFCGGGVLQLNNFREMRGFGWPAFSKMNLKKQEKGQRELVRKFIKLITSDGQFAYSIEEYLSVSKFCIQVAEINE